MHIVDGLVSPPVLFGASAAAVAGVALGLRALDPDRLPRVAMTSAAFFVASLVHVPIGPASTHLMLTGLGGLLLGWTAFPALLVALLLQAAFFGFGGVTALGVNTVVLAVPAVVAGAIARLVLRWKGPGSAFAAGALAGGSAVLMAAGLLGALLAVSGPAFVPLAQALMAAHLPVTIVEALVTGAALSFLMRVKPEAVPVSFPAAAAGTSHA